MADARQEYVEKVKSLIVSYPMKFISAWDNTIYDIHFGSDGKAEGESFTSWKLLDDNRRGKMQVRLFRGADMSVWVWLERDGLWSGKDMRNGNCELRSLEINKPAWKNMHDQRLFDADKKQPELPTGLKFLDQPPPQVQWDSYEWNIAENGDLPQHRTAIAIAGCNRLDYFKAVVQNLAQNPTIGSYPVVCFLDKPRREAEFPLTQMQADFVKEKIPQVRIIKRPRNFGCGRNIIDIRRQMFDNAGYERLFVFEDDCIPSINYLTLMESMLDWAQATYSNVGVVQGWSECFIPTGSKVEHLDEVRSTYENWWGYLQTKESWDASKDHIYAYENLFLNIDDYLRRPHRSIVEWMRMKVKYAKPTPYGDRPLPMNSRALDEEQRWMMNHYSSGQDGITAIGTYLAGYKHLATAVNRAHYIGKSGIHATPEFYEYKKYGEIVLDEFESDVLRKEFRVV